MSERARKNKGGAWIVCRSASGYSSTRSRSRCGGLMDLPRFGALSTINQQATTALARNTTNLKTGFRCCADPQ